MRNEIAIQLRPGRPSTGGANPIAGVRLPPELVKTLDKDARQLAAKSA